MVNERKCKMCGCTDNDCRQCIKRTGRPCYWFDQDLCSACATSPLFKAAPGYPPNPILRYRVLYVGAEGDIGIFGETDNPTEVASMRAMAKLLPWVSSTRVVDTFASRAIAVGGAA